MKTKIVILAAGKGTRMGSDLPKALVPVSGRPMIAHLADSVSESGLDDKPVVVVSPGNMEEIKAAMNGYDWNFVIQEQQLGTGHAVNSARSAIGEADQVLVLYCDHPFVRSASIKAMGSEPTDSVLIMPALLNDFEGWRHNFFHWGRIVRNNVGGVERIVEFKDASPEEIAITEVNPGFMCFNKEWLFSNIDKLHDDNNAHEFYLTDMVKIAFSQGHTVKTIPVEAHEAMGINSKEELLIAETIMAEREKEILPEVAA
ncbi:MAG: NTP transferase domain-containing protein [Bacillota bacterium]